ncbi:MAG TPA: RsmB/NOP family class I SAM-dependent RNA methyltransferase [Albidovulum sp.]|uniref:RsmB/NOP family class I SAM-dependent RNA methyltransferase n=1 Tax=Albidovulum sp. TaxID=1872424 RepID=UPI002C56ADB5|nr:RsmB/NOP family class I SAM-dependent RNA methyltransferase [Albidovulum sp.]
MTPAARIAAAIGILDRVLGGSPAEQALTGWARGSRFAGSRDRAAVRDHVYDALRCLRSFTALGGGGAPDGRKLTIGLLRSSGTDPAEIFTGDGYGPPPLTAAELAGADPTALPRWAALDCPDWIGPQLERALGPLTDAVLVKMRERAPAILRVNAGKGTVEGAIASLAGDGIGAAPHALASFALEVTENASKIRNSAAYASGFVELQDAAPQAAVEALPLKDGMRVLDYCAGGGGKTLAMAARGKLKLFAHDAAPQRMADLPARAARAGVRVTALASNDIARHAPFDLVLTDVPCTGTGTWRRAPDAKWTLTQERLADLVRVQATILDRGAALSAPGGWLIYMTCSLLAEENRDQIEAFLTRHPAFTLRHERLITPVEAGDGFYTAHLSRV